jgi:hypothetical protein
LATAMVKHRAAMSLKSSPGFTWWNMSEGYRIG